MRYGYNDPDPTVFISQSVFIYSIAMLITCAKYWAKPLSLILLVILNLSFVWCPDGGCSSDELGDGCTSLLCIVLHSQSSESNRPGHSSEASAKSCSCVAQSPSLVPSPGSLNCVIACQALTIAVEANILSSPNRPLFRPPVSAATSPVI